MGLEGRTRRAVRKAIKNKVEIVEGSEREIDEYYKMVQATYERSNTSPPPIELLKLFYERLYPKKSLIFLNLYI